MADANEKLPEGWAAGLDAEHQTFIQGRGWDKLAGTAAALASKTVDIEANRRELSREWGANEGRNKFVAARAMDTLKLAPEAIGALESLPGVGYRGVMNMFLQLGEMQGEARFVPGSVGGTLAPDQAQAKWDLISQDPSWRARWADGGATEIKDKS